MLTINERYDEAIKLKTANKLDESIEKLKELVADSPDFALAHTALSVLLMKQGRLDESLNHAKLVCELEPNDPFSFTSMSIVCRSAGKLSEAEDALAQAMKKQLDAQV